MCTRNTRRPPVADGAATTTTSTPQEENRPHQPRRPHSISPSRDMLAGMLARRRSETSPAAAPASRGHATEEATPLAELRPRGPPFSTRPRFVPHRRWRVAGGPRGLSGNRRVWRTPTVNVEPGSFPFRREWRCARCPPTAGTAPEGDTSRADRHGHQPENRTC